MKQYHHVLVAIDGSKEADLAFEKAIGIVKDRSDTTLDILHVIDTRSFQNVSSFDSEMVEQVSSDAQEKIKHYYHIAQKYTANVHYTIEFGSPKTIIAHDFSQKHQIDLIILGATGLNAVERLLIGSVTKYVTQAAESDVLVCRGKEN